MGGKKCNQWPLVGWVTGAVVTAAAPLADSRLVASELGTTGVPFGPPPGGVRVGSAFLHPITDIKTRVATAMHRFMVNLLNIKVYRCNTVINNG